MTRSVLHRGPPLLMKPFNRADLAARVRAILDQPAT